LLAQGARQNGRAQPQEFITYKEQIWITGGAPVEFVGTMTRRQNGQITNAQSGRFTVTYEVRPSAATAPGVYIDRTITYTIDWRREGNQIIENIRLVGANAWRENITIGDTVFTIDPRQSHKSISLIRDEHPGVTYFSGDMAKRAVFTSNGATIVHEVSGRIYGYNSAWSATETHILTGIVSTPAWQLHYQQTPSVTVNSVLQFVPTEPTAISFAGNYREVLQNRSGMTWSINVLPNAFYGAQTSGSSYISSFNTFEQLPAPDVEFLHGHWAQPDIRRLFSMQVLSGEPRHFRPEQGVTRAQFVTMLVRAARMPLVQPTQAQLRNARNGNVTGLVFPDVPPDRPDFPYIMSAYEAGLIRGRGQGRFYTDFIMSREEAYVLTLRILGLTNLGPDPTPMTPFVDDSYIGDWARRDIYAAARIGLIFPDQNGRIHPQQMMTNAEAAALVNRLINYMRHDLARDYTENIINFN
ncbi:MAG: S-layer homology domain-containing protein, partial [Defluviitaleaceae bacterium]|nr:S-layer homology domain-containing protein [Defluviitaleaceae bacterium]